MRKNAGPGLFLLLTAVLWLVFAQVALANSEEAVWPMDDGLVVYLPLNFNTIELTQEDRDIIRKCKRDAFKAPTKKPDNNASPLRNFGAIGGYNA